jgi:hypothetical protein
MEYLHIRQGELSHKPCACILEITVRSSLLVTQQTAVAEVYVRIGPSLRIAEANDLALCVIPTITRADRPQTHRMIRTAHIVPTPGAGDHEGPFPRSSARFCE